MLGDVGRVQAILLRYLISGFDAKVGDQWRATCILHEELGNKECLELTTFLFSNNGDL